MTRKTKIKIDINRYEASKIGIKEVADSFEGKRIYPLVYVWYNETYAYVGETVRLARFDEHLDDEKKKQFSHFVVVTCDKFHKSATMDIEFELIRYMRADGKFKLTNGNSGLQHEYPNKEDYNEVFDDIWEMFGELGLAVKSLKDINNSDILKYSPYKRLSKDQYISVVQIINGLIKGTVNSTIAEGAAGTGKTVLAIFLFKLLKTELSELFGPESKDVEGKKLIASFQDKYPNPKIALVVPVRSFRNTLKDVFSKVEGLKRSMVIGPADVTKRKYDILFVDEAHRLRRRVALTGYEGFDACNSRMGLGNEGTELDWVLKQSEKQVFFYDPSQSIRPSDVRKERFDELAKGAINLTLKSQLRIRGGEDYVDYVRKLLTNSIHSATPRFKRKQYEFLIFDSFKTLFKELKNKEKRYGLCRLIAGFSWEWKTKNKEKGVDIDMIIEKIPLRWNSQYNKWINSENASREVGCIHTTQGYDLNYAGIIFGEEISYDPETDKIFVRPDKYLDRKGKEGVKDAEELLKYIVNIYQTSMYRGIMGTYLYVADKNLRVYLKEHITSVRKK